MNLVANLFDFAANARADLLHALPFVLRPLQLAGQLLDAVEPFRQCGPIRKPLHIVHNVQSDIQSRSAAARCKPRQLISQLAPARRRRHLISAGLDATLT